MKTPWHIWVIGIITLLWNTGGFYDFVMMQTQNQNYLAGLPQVQRDFFHQFPIWAHITWAIGVIGAVLGSVLLLLRRAWAVPVFAASLAGMVATTIHNLFVASPSALDLMGMGAVIFSIMIFVVAVGLWLYARAMRTGGILR